MILITGATGFLGYNLCTYLTTQDYKLRALVRSNSNTDDLEALGVDIFRGDVTEAETMTAAAHGCQYIIHAAAHFRFWGDPEPFYKTNVDGTYHALEAGLAAGVKKFIHISTIIVVGPQKPGQVITEESICCPHPTDTYAQTKFLGERLAQSYIQKGLPVVILRLGALYGPHGHYAFNRLFFEEFFKNWRVQVQQGKNFIFPCYVGDASQAIEAALRLGQRGEIYNVSDQSISHKEANQTVSELAKRSSWRINVPTWLMLSFVQVLEVLARFTNREPFYPQNLKPYVFCDWIVDSSKAERVLEFKPTTFAEGAKRTLEWYRSIGYI